MRTNLSLEDLAGFLSEPHVAILATTRKDGTVLLSPVWHEWRDGGFNVWTGTKVGGNDPAGAYQRIDGVDPLPLSRRAHSTGVGKKLQQAARRHIGIQWAIFR